MDTNSKARNAAMALRARKLAFGAGTAILMVGGTANAQQITPQAEDPWQHFVDCVGVMFSAPDIHALYCSPSQVPAELSEISSESSGDKRAVGPTSYPGPTGEPGPTGDPGGSPEGPPGGSPEN